MVEYEVTLDITDTDKQAYKVWLTSYINETRNLDGFIDVKYSITNILNKEIACIRYIVESRKILENFIQNKEEVFESIDKSLKKRILSEGDI